MPQTDQYQPGLPECAAQPEFTSQSSLSTSMQRLSSGLRVNSAKDDAAGLAIAERMARPGARHERRLMRNANDAHLAGADR